MPIDFPTSPSANQVVSLGAKKYQWTGEQWAAKNAAAGGPWRQVTSTYTAVDNDRISANTSGGSFTINLPASPTFGTNVTFVDHAKTWDTNNLTIGRNTKTIEGLAENLTCDVNGDMVMTLLYNGTTWKVYV